MATDPRVETKSLRIEDFAKLYIPHFIGTVSSISILCERMYLEDVNKTYKSRRKISSRLSKYEYRLDYFKDMIDNVHTKDFVFVKDLNRLGDSILIYQDKINSFSKRTDYSYAENIEYFNKNILPYGTIIMQFDIDFKKHFKEYCDETLEKKLEVVKGGLAKLSDSSSYDFETYLYADSDFDIVVMSHITLNKEHYTLHNHLEYMSKKPVFVN